MRGKNGRQLPYNATRSKPPRRWCPRLGIAARARESTMRTRQTLHSNGGVCFIHHSVSSKSLKKAPWCRTLSSSGCCSPTITGSRIRAAASISSLKIQASPSERRPRESGCGEDRLCSHIGVWKPSSASRLAFSSGFSSLIQPVSTCQHKQSLIQNPQMII